MYVSSLVPRHSRGGGMLRQMVYMGGPKYNVGYYVQLQYNTMFTVAVFEGATMDTVCDS